MTDIQIHIEGLDKIMEAFKRFPAQVVTNIAQAGKESGEEILNTQGLRRYPPMTAANKPPTPYYIRGRGTQLKRGNLGNSERYGTQFYVRHTGWQTEVGNRASYAKYLADENKQATAMANKGWRKLIDVAREKTNRIGRIYGAWVERTLREVGL